jgi:methyl-accepting chemotaxis protein
MPLSIIRSKSLAVRLYGAFAVFLLIATILSVGLLKTAWTELERVKAARLANSLADAIIAASAEYARERAAGGIALGQANADQDSLARLKALREKADKFYLLALEQGKRILETDPDNARFVAARESMLKTHSELAEARAVIDDHLVNAASVSLGSKDWIKLATRHIDSLAETRLASFRVRTANEVALAANLRVKHLIWIATEFAGRERGNLAPLITDRKPIPPELLSQLSSWRTVVEQSLREVIDMRNDPGMSDEFRKSVDQMEKTFLVEWSARRNEVYKAVTTGAYPLNGTEWVKEATQGIDSVLSVAATVSTMTAQTLDEESISKKAFVVFLGMALLLICTLSFFVVWLVRSDLIGPLTKLIASISGSSEEVTRVADKVAQSSQTLSGASSEQSSALVETSSSMEELSAMVGRNNASAVQAAELSTMNEVNAKRGQGVMKDLRQAIEEIHSTNERFIEEINAANRRMEEVAEAINGIRLKTKLIDEIVFQTKLLSFNASVEAARAGEAGKGFAVVAEEVGALAQNSGTASREITTLITESVAKFEEIKVGTGETVSRAASVTREKVERGLRVAGECEKVLGDILDDATALQRMVNEISQASDQQQTGVTEINRALHQLEQTTGATASTSSQAAEAAKGLSLQAGELNQVVRHLKVIVTGAS